jgi:hypothetical protein
MLNFFRRIKMRVKLILNVMKKQKMYAGIFLLIGFILFTTKVYAQDSNFYIYLCFGQSNMEGQGTIEAIDRTVDSRFQVMQAVDCSNLGRTKGSWYTAIPPLCRCWNGLSPADYYGKTMVLNLPDSIRVGVINVSVGGCQIELFDKDIYQDYDSTYTEDWFLDIIKAYNGNPYGYLVDLAKQAQEDGIIKGILLHQGESNTGDTEWPSKVNTIYENLMDDLDLDPDSVPLLAGEVVHADQGGICSSMNSIIAKLPQTIPNSYVISSSGCTDKEDNIHFNSAGYRELGKRYAVTMLSIMGYDTTNLQYPEVSSMGVENSIEVPGGYVLEENYPNPFNPTTSIKYYLPHKGKVTFEVLDITGRIVEMVVVNVESIGEHTITFDGSGLSSGIYFYRLRTSTGFMQSKKMLLVK